MPYRFRPVSSADMQRIEAELQARRNLEIEYFETFRETQGRKPRRDPADMSDDDLRHYIDQMRKLY